MAGGRVLVTGASGFVGQGLVPALRAAGYGVRVALRTPGPLPDGVESAVIGDLRRPINLAEALHGVGAVVHIAGLAHSAEAIPDETYRAINAGVTEALAKAAAQAGVKRFVLMSSVRAQTGPSASGVVTEALPPAPTDAYGRSKLEAETLLGKVDINGVVLRPVLIHGPGMRYNMAALAGLARSRWPLPLRSLKARRSILARDHLGDAVLLALANESMTGPYLVADPEPLTVGEMVAALRAGWGRGAGTLPAPRWAVGLGARLAGRVAEFERLDSPLVVDASRLRAAGWTPRRSATDALAETARTGTVTTMIRR